MDELDIVYKAFKDYRNQIKNESGINSFKNDLKGKANILEKLESLATTCVIEPSWIEEIDFCLPYVIKAVKEERQFVKNEGEVLSIDRVRNVSKESVEDLAKHSSYITKLPDESGKVIPDKLLMSKKESDYAIYENRFLYTLLEYMYQFIEIRLNDILSLTGKYEAQTQIIKKQSNTKRIIDFNLNFHEKRFNDAITRKGNNSQDAIDKIQSYLIQTRSLLSTPLMKEVSTKPKVGFPIVKTNILKFNTNFKNSLRLFDFLHSYKGKGYEVKITKKNMSPFAPSLSDQFAEVIYLSSFITYILTNGFDKTLAKTYEENEAKKKKAEEDKYLKDMKKAEKSFKESGLTEMEYIEKLVKANEILEKHVKQKDEEIEDMKNDYALLKSEIKEEVLKGKQEQRDEDLNEIDQLREANESIKIEYGTLLQDKENEKIAAINEANLKIEEITASSQAELDRVSTELNNTISTVQKENAKHLETNRALQAEIIGLREICNMPTIGDFTNRDDFDELEEEKIAFEKFFERTWKSTKKAIRKNMLLGKNK